MPENQSKRKMISDAVQFFQLDQANMRGRFVHLDGILDQIISQHDYPEWVGFQLSEALMLNAAMASALKLKGKLSLQVQSEGAIKLIATDYFASKNGDAPRLRGYVRYDEALYEPENSPYGKGVFGLILDQGAGLQPYQGVSELDENLRASATRYFKQSEQIPTAIISAVGRERVENKWHGGLIMVQQIAEEGGQDNPMQKKSEDFASVQMLMGTLQNLEFLAEDISSEQLLYRLFHEYDPTAHPAEPLKFGCSCSQDRVRQSLSIYSQKDLSHMTTDEGMITADCQFCGRHYELDPSSVGFEAG